MGVSRWPVPGGIAGLAGLPDCWAALLIAARLSARRHSRWPVPGGLNDAAWYRAPLHHPDQCRLAARTERSATIPWTNPIDSSPAGTRDAAACRCCCQVARSTPPGTAHPLICRISASWLRALCDLPVSAEKSHWPARTGRRLNGWLLRADAGARWPSRRRLVPRTLRSACFREKVPLAAARPAEETLPLPDAGAKWPDQRSKVVLLRCDYAVVTHVQHKPPCYGYSGTGIVRIPRL